MLSKSIFVLSHEAVEPNFYPVYRHLVKNQWRKPDEIKKEQESYLKNAIRFYYDNVPYYHRLFKSLSLMPDSISTVKDLEKLPILTRDMIKKDLDDFKPKNLRWIRNSELATGGTTGTPFKYRLSSLDRFYGGALMYRGWGYGGYELGDKMVFLGGSSLGIGTKPNIVKRVHEIGRNIRKCSAFDMGEKDMEQYVRVINEFKPRFIRGYAGSIYFLAKWISENDVKVHCPEGVFTTTEKLYPNMRKMIGDVFYCDVYDNYGLNDGGVSAYECSSHMGLHIDSERSVMEVVDENGDQLEEGEGRILATGLHNFAMPFIRYDTGDIGHIIRDVCGCGRGHGLLKEVIGRSADTMFTPEGKNVHGWFFLYIFWENCTGIKEYQVVQESIDRLEIKMVIEEGFDERQLDKIREIVRSRSEGWKIEFMLVDKIERTGAGKFKFIINKLYEKST